MQTKLKKPILMLLTNELRHKCRIKTPINLQQSRIGESEKEVKSLNGTDYVKPN